MDKNYQLLLAEIKSTIQSERIKAARQLTRSLIGVYFEIGRQILESQKIHGWGKGIVEQLSKDLRSAFPSSEGFSARNLWDMRRFYETYCDFPNLRQLVAEIPWGHHLVIMSKSETQEQREYYIQASSAMGWSRDVLLNQMKAKAYERQLLQPKQTNFHETLPEHLAEQANEAIKSTYNLEFLGINQPVLELELERQLLHRLKNFLLELGYGFTFVGNQYPLKLGEKTYYVDLLFFHRGLKCLVAIELKIGSFKPEYAGKMNFHLELLDEQVKMQGENPSIGIILCAEKDNLEVEYALRTSNKPVGVVEYLLSAVLPENLTGQLPSPEEIKQQFNP
ncbi:MAG: PDDEXK nuclease domain-containing protein [Saprospiraceae bacterium]|nr:PDDEXK nuclease domain-containing protein [Saprospiraceae bacterium]